MSYGEAGAGHDDPVQSRESGNKGTGGCAGSVRERASGSVHLRRTSPEALSKLIPPPPWSTSISGPSTPRFSQYKTQLRLESRPGSSAGKGHHRVPEVDRNCRWAAPTPKEGA
jgi:hypothetical protein